MQDIIQFLCLFLRSHLKSTFYKKDIHAGKNITASTICCTEVLYKREIHKPLHTRQVKSSRTNVVIVTAHLKVHNALPYILIWWFNYHWPTRCSCCPRCEVAVACIVTIFCRILLLLVCSIFIWNAAISATEIVEFFQSSVIPQANQLAECFQEDPPIVTVRFLCCTLWFLKFFSIPECSVPFHFLWCYILTENIDPQRMCCEGYGSRRVCMCVCQSVTMLTGIHLVYMLRIECH